MAAAHRSRARLRAGTAWCCLALAALAGLTRAAKAPCPKLLGYTIIAEYPHDKESFTQGLQYDHECDDLARQQCYDIFWESSGLYGESTVRKVVLSTGEVKQKLSLQSQWFAEGLTRLGDYLYQLTWQTGTMFKWSVKGGTIAPVGALQGPLRDGWGLTTDGTHLIVTDNSAVVSFLDPDTLQVARRLTVKDGTQEVKWLNELEYIEGELWANVWQTECIARVNVTTGQVTAWVLMHGLLGGLLQRNPDHVHMDVLNGIAYDKQSKRLFVTGKKWPRVFEVALGPQVHTSFNVQQARRQCIPS